MCTKRVHFQRSQGEVSNFHGPYYMLALSLVIYTLMLLLKHHYFADYIDPLLRFIIIMSMKGLITIFLL